MSNQNIFTNMLNFWISMHIINTVLHNLINFLDIFLWRNNGNLIL